MSRWKRRGVDLGEVREEKKNKAEDRSEEKNREQSSRRGAYITLIA